MRRGRPREQPRAATRQLAIAATLVALATTVFLAPPARAQDVSPALDPDQSKPGASTRTDTAHVELRANQRNQTFYVQLAPLPGERRRRDPTSDFEPLCTAPCGAYLSAGYHRIGLSGPNGRVTAPERGIDIRDGATIRGDHTGDPFLRTLGIGVLIVGPIGGLAMMIASMGSNQGLMVAGGLVTIPVTIGAGVVLVLLGRERVSLEVEVASAPAAPHPFLSATEGATRTPDLAATLRF